MVKIAVNFLVAAAIEATAEATSLVESYRVDPGRFVDLLAGTVVPGPVYATYGRPAAERGYGPAGFTTRLGPRDVRPADSAARDRRLELPTADPARDALSQAIAAGWADHDWAVLAEVARNRAGADGQDVTVPGGCTASGR
ncbi:NAD-binding protein [Streptomyces sp. JNUCC 63]